MKMNNILQSAKSIGFSQNLILRVLDEKSGDVVQEHVAHNTATNTLLTGIGHYLAGEGVFEQGYHMLSAFVPRYISLGTMGLINQFQDENGLPAGIGVRIPQDGGEEYRALLKAVSDAKKAVDEALAALNAVGCCELCTECPSYINGACPSKVLHDRLKQLYDEAVEAYDRAYTNLLNYTGSEERRFIDYMNQRPGYGADGYDINQNNNRTYFGLGPKFSDRLDKTTTINCELISNNFPRAKISFRDIVPEVEAELPKTIDVVFSAMISTGALAQFRPAGQDYLFITEAGLWADQTWSSTDSNGDNGLLAGYRIMPSNEHQWDMTDENNRLALKKSILRVQYNQVVQVIWKIQIGSIDQFSTIEDLRKQYYSGIDEASAYLNFEKAKKKLIAFKELYQNVVGLDDVFAAIDRL